MAPMTVQRGPGTAAACSMTAILIGAPCVYATASRYYSAFTAAKALALDDRRITLPGTASGSVRLR